jgi:hypothetical protein
MICFEICATIGAIHQPSTTVKRIRLVLAGLLLVQTLPAAERPPLPNFDLRTAPGRSTPRMDAAALASRAVAEDRLKARLPGVIVQRLPLTGSASWIAARDSFLTGPNGQGGAMAGADADRGLPPNDPHRLVKSFVREHAGVFGHDHTALEKARLTRDTTAAHNGLRTAAWEQQVAGIPIHRGAFIAHLSRNGELITVGSEFLANPETAAPVAQQEAVTRRAVLPITALRALNLSTQNLGVAEPAEWESVSGPEGVERIQKFATLGWPAATRVALIWLPMDALSVRLCWRVWMTEPVHNTGYELFIDATTGEVLKRRCVTEHASAPATYNVFTSESPTPFSPGFNSPGTNQPPTASRSLFTMTSLSGTASPNGWVDVGVNQLRGNNANAYYMKATSESSWSGTQVNGDPSRVFDFPMDLTKSPETRAEAATVNAFYWVNWMHDKLYALGFTETERNCQETNFNRGGLGGDPMTVTVNSPGDEDNASMTSWAEGSNPVMALGVFTGPNPDRETAWDAEIILHEYAHALSNRMIGDGSGLDGDAVQSRGMGEDWGDFYALALTSQSSDNVNGNYPKAAYSSFHLWGSDYEANYYSGIRRYPYTTDMSRNPLTFKDIDPEQASPHYGIPMNPVLVGSSASEVHNIGEVWCSMLWEARARLIQKHGFSTGNQLILQLVTDGMSISPNDPSFITSRNAILLADNALTGGANRNELWAAFAKRGLGVQATAPASTSTAGIKESFDSLDALNVLPADGVTVAGPVGGPFVPSGKTYTLTNDSNSSLSWRAYAEPPLELGTASGNLAAHARQSVAVNVNAAAAGTLPQGAYAYSVFFTNQTSGLVLERVFSLVLGLKHVPTERFTGENVNDLAHRTLWFEPDGTGTNYSLCRTVPSPSTFPVDPSSAQTLDLSNSTAVVVILTGGAKFPFFGEDYTELEIGRDGSIVPGAIEAQYSDTPGLYGHFAVPRISGIRTGYSGSKGRVSWQQLADRAVVTWEDVVPNGYTSISANFQVQLYFDGRIRLTVLDNTVDWGICGLSAGGGAPPFFVETDLSTSPSCTEPMLELQGPVAVAEGGFVLQNMVVSLGGRTAVTPLVINVSSSDTSEISVPATVTIPAGQSEAPISYTVLNDSIRDGTQVAFITVSRSGYTSASLPIRVHDNETAAISVSIPATKTEAGFLSLGTVSLSAAAGGLVSVNLQSSLPSALNVPPVVFIEPGKTAATFNITAPDNNRIEGPLSATVTASVANWTPGSDSITILDDESTNLTMFSNIFLNESSGTVTNGSVVQISGILTTNLPIFLISDDESEVRTPLFGGFIPAGSTSVSFPLFVQDDAIIDGFVVVRLRALAGGFGSATNSVFVFDNDGPPEPYDPYPPHEAENVPLHIDLAWGRAEGELIVNGGFEAGNLAGWSIETPAGGFVLNDGAYDPQSPDGPLPPLTGSFSALSDQAGGGTHVLYQDIFIPDGSTNVTLRWTDQVRNHGGPFNALHRFRVEVRDTNNAVLATLFSTPTNLPAFTGPTNRSADLKPWRGGRIRLAFVEQDALGFLNVHLDNVSVVAASASPTIFDVYFGNDTVPDETEYLGSTTNASWPLLPLGGGLIYQWRIDTRRGGVTNTGPIWRFTAGGSSLATVPMAFGSAWKYVATGVNLGTGWRSPSYNDVLWQTAVAPLGFGGSEATTIGDSRDEFTTFYFRRRLTLLDTNRLATVTASLRRDDGAVVYVNGVEAFRDNMPKGNISYLTQASSVVSGGDETTSQLHVIDPAFFIEGTNIIAVEVHQRDERGGPSPDLYFDLAFTTRTNTGNMAPWLVSWITPGDFDVARTPTNLLLRASVADDNLSGTKLEFFADGAKLGEDSATPFAFTWTNPPVGLHTLLTVATDSGGLSVTSLPLHVVVVPPTGTSLATLIAGGSPWLYLDTGIFPGPKWTLLNYEDSRTGWKSGPAQLGYGDGDEKTVVDYGRNQFARNITTWFRRHFTRSADLSSLSMRVLRDDGVVVYLNGTEIFRNNLPGGTIATNTLAVVALSGSAESAWLNVSLNSQVVLPLLNEGDNVIAAEVHQASANSPDMSFDLELTGIGNLLPAVVWTTPANNSVYLAPGSVPLNATASDAYGSVIKVEFFRNGASLGFVTAPPYQLSWSSPPLGVHSLTAVATDNLGATKMSSPITVTIVPPAMIAAQRGAGSVELSWPLSASGYRVESAASLTSPILWQAVTNNVTQASGFFRLLVDDTEAQRYFRLVAP